MRGRLEPADFNGFAGRRHGNGNFNGKQPRNRLGCVHILIQIAGSGRFGPDKFEYGLMCMDGVDIVQHQLNRGIVDSLYTALYVDRGKLARLNFGKVLML